MGTGPRTRIISTQGLASMRDNIVTVFGSRTAEALIPLDEASTNEISMHGCASTLHGHMEGRCSCMSSASNGWCFLRFVSRASASFGKLAGERHYFFLNGRPVNLPKASTCPALSHV